MPINRALTRQCALRDFSREVFDTEFLIGNHAATLIMPIGDIFGSQISIDTQLYIIGHACRGR